MSPKTEDFPTPASPTRRIVYGPFILFFDLVTPFLRDSTSLGNQIRTVVPKITLRLLDTWVVVNGNLSSDSVF